MPIFESSRKIQAHGSSLALTLPALFVKANGVKKGSVMNILYCLDGVLVASQVKNLEALMESLKVIINKLDDMIAKRCIEEGGDAGLRWGLGRWRRLDHEREEKAGSS